MANGIGWFRWHHGTVTDPKFQLVARRAGASVAEVIAVWALLLEAASAAQERGSVGHQDFEAIDCALGLDDGRAASIYAQMQARGLVDEGGNLPKWSERQPSRERESDSSAERVRRHRERKRQADSRPEACNGETGVTDVTPSNASNGQETPREEKRREEERRISTPDTSLETENSLGLDTHRASARAQPLASADEVAPGASPTAAGEACRAMRQAGLPNANPAHPELQALIAAGATTAQFAQAAAVAVKRGKGFAYAIGVLRGQLADAASTPKPGKTAGSESAYIRNQAVAAAWLAEASIDEGETP